ncbi:MAG: hypothetical protein QOE08_2056 [Thermoleophilaceae bacterium]|nr:hypothetical protein [Thermoleophilaceae bacterium]
MRLAIAALLPVIALAGCANADQHRGPAQKPAYDPRDSTIGCLGGAGFHAVKVEPNAIRVDDPAGPVRIVFEATVGEAEAANLKPETSGGEVIGDAILYVGKTPENDLGKMEKCLE